MSGPLTSPSLVRTPTTRSRSTRRSRHGVSRRTDTSGYQYLNQVYTNSYTDFGLANGTHYYYQIYAYNNSIASGLTPEVSALVSVVVDAARERPARAALTRLVVERGAHLEGPVPVCLLAAVGAGAIHALPRFPHDLLARARGVSATRSSVTLAVPAVGRVAAVRKLHKALVEPNSPRTKRAHSARGPFAPRTGRPPASRSPRVGAHRRTRTE